MSSGITVVVPVRNGARYLAAALASLTEQSVPPAAIVVVDDGSRDGSGDVARAAGATAVLRVGTEEAGIGVGAARNVGARAATTELLAFLDADDLCAPDRFALQLGALEREPMLDGVLGHVRQFVSPDRPELADRYDIPSEPMPGWHAGALLVARERFAATDGWSDDPDRHDAFDWFAVSREQGLRLEMLDETVLERRIHGDNVTLQDRQELHARYLLSARDAIRRRAAGA